MTNIIVSFLRFLTGLITDWLPALPLDDGTIGRITEAVRFFVGLVANVNWIVPVEDALAIMGLILAYKAVLLSMFAINWIIKRLRGG